MLTIDDYINRAKTAQKLNSDRDLDRALGFKGQPTSHWRTKRTWPADETMVKLAEMAGIDPAQALMDLGIWRASSPKVSAIYSSISERLAKVSAMVIFLLLAYPVQRTEAAQINISNSNTIHYAIFGCQRPQVARAPQPS